MPASSLNASASPLASREKVSEAMGQCTRSLRTDFIAIFKGSLFLGSSQMVSEGYGGIE
jgi:hypothetical protein